MIRIDLHIHSIFSDGTCTPMEIARVARRKGISVLALTDHDTLDGQEAFSEACDRCSLQAICGIELSADAPTTVHILGYRMTALRPMQDALAWIIEKRVQRNIEMSRRLQALGLEITYAEVEREASGRIVARPHFASVLVKKGFVRDYADAFARYLGDDGAAYVGREAYSPQKCISLIRACGGLPVLAHPSQMRMDAETLDEYVGMLKQYGLWGIECVSPHCGIEQSLYYFALAQKHALFPTAGSDFHGARRPDAHLGVQVREDFLPWARLGVTI